MQASFLRAFAPRLPRVLALCRGCLGPLGAGAEAGLCGPCWEGLLPLPEGRCPRCALLHPAETECPEPVAWEQGDALWDYHGGRPALGALLVPSIKQGEQGWKSALLRRARQAPRPPWIADANLITFAPTAFHRRWLRGFDLGEETARQIAQDLGVPCRRTLSKSAFTTPQSERNETQRRRLPRKAITLRPNAPVQDRIILLVDDVWTTGTTLLRCAQELREAGAKEVRVLTLFRAM